MNLERYCEIKEELKNIELILQELNTQLYNIRRSNVSDVPKSKGISAEDKMINIIMKIEKEKEKYIKKYEKYLEEYIKITNIIDNFKGIEKRIIIERYIYDMTWEEISKNTGYSRTQLYRIHKNFIKKINNATIWNKNMCYYCNITSLIKVLL